MLKARLIIGALLIGLVLAVFWFDGFLDGVTLSGFWRDAFGGREHPPPGLPIFALIVACTILSSKLKLVTPRRILLLVLPAVYFSAVHSVFVGSVRYRLTTMPLLEILAAVAWIALWDRFARRAHTGANARVR